MVFTIIIKVEQIFRNNDLELNEFLSGIDTGNKSKVQYLTYKGQPIADTELIERIKFKDVMTNLLYLKDKIMKSELNNTTLKAKAIMK